MQNMEEEQYLRELKKHLLTQMRKHKTENASKISNDQSRALLQNDSKHSAGEPAQVDTSKYTRPSSKTGHQYVINPDSNHGDGEIGTNKQMIEDNTKMCRSAGKQRHDGRDFKKTKEKAVQTMANVIDESKGDLFEAAVKNQVNSIIRKLQRNYISHLKDHIALMEQIQRIPEEVKNIYKDLP